MNAKINSRLDLLSYALTAAGRCRPDLRAALEEELSALEKFLYKLALRLCGGHACDARDLVQDTLLRGLERIAEMPADLNLRGWFGTILHNRFIDLCRGRSREQPSPLEPEAYAMAAAEPEAEAPWETVTAAEFRSALERLDCDLQRLIRLHVWERQRYKDIAKLLGIPIGTVGSQLTRARKLLRAFLFKKMEES